MSGHNSAFFWTWTQSLIKCCSLLAPVDLEWSNWSRSMAFRIELSRWNASKKRASCSTASSGTSWTRRIFSCRSIHRSFSYENLSLKNAWIFQGLHKTFKDNKFVYLLTDAYLGGDLWRLLHSKGPFSDTNARFYVGCVLEAFAYLHKR